MDYLDDIASDLSVFHRVDDMWALPAPRFFSLVYRLPFYAGVLQARYIAEKQEQDEKGAATPLAAPAPTRSGSSVREVEATPQALMSDPALSLVVDYG